MNPLYGALTVWLPVVAVILFVSSYLTVAALRRWSVDLGLVDVPNERSSHAMPTPSGGGIAMVLLVIAGWIVVTQAGTLLFGYPQVQPSHALAFVAGGLLIAGIGLIDDLRHVSYRIRLLVHIGAALVFVVFYTYWTALQLPVLGLVGLGTAGAVLSVVWIVGLTNAYNFIDGLDGLAAGQAVAAGAGWTALGLATNHPLITAAGILLATSSMGFLIHNWHPARIFMGDVGSTFLGYSFAIMPLIAARYDTRLALAGVLLVWPAIFDSTITVLGRLARHENIFEGHREFLFHRLVACGWSHASASALYVPLPLLGAALAFTWQYGNSDLHAAVVAGLVTLCAWLWLFVRQVELNYSARLAHANVVTLRSEYLATEEPQRVPSVAV